MSEDKLREQINKFEATYNDLLSDNRWQQTPFLKVMHSKLTQLKNELTSIIESSGIQEKTTPKLEKVALPESEDFQKLFIYLYSSDGKKIDSWQRVVANIDKQFISRPIYLEEADVQHAVLHAPVTFNAGYVAIWVDKNFINIVLDEDKPKDKYGRELVSLKDNAIILEKIDYFWNNFVQYHWLKDKLIFSKQVERLQK